MKRLFGVIAAFLISSGAYAAPILWTIPPTALLGGTTMSGTFTWDAATSVMSNINIDTTGALPATLRFPGVLFPNGNQFLQQTAVAAIGDRGAWIGLQGVPAGGGNWSTPVLAMVVCLTAPLCSAGGSSQFAVNVALTGVPFVAPVVPPVIAPAPTLSEYAMFALASLLIMFSARQLRRRGLV